MALAKQPVSILSGVLDTKTDPKTAPLGRVVQARNVTRQKTGRYDRRTGRTGLGVDSMPSGTLAQPWQGASYKDGLISLSENGTAGDGISPYSPSQGRWSKPGSVDTNAVRTFAKGPMMTSLIQVQQAASVPPASGMDVAVMTGTNFALVAWEDGNLVTWEAIYDLATNTRIHLVQLSGRHPRVSVVGTSVVLVYATIDTIVVREWSTEADMRDGTPSGTLTVNPGWAANAVGNAGYLFDTVYDATTSELLLAVYVVGGNVWMMEYAMGAVYTWADLGAVDASMTIGWLRDDGLSGRRWLATAGATDGVRVRNISNLTVTATITVDATATTFVRNVAGHTTTAATSGTFVCIWDYVPTLLTSPLIPYNHCTRYGVTTTGTPSAVNDFCRSLCMRSKTLLFAGSHYVLLAYDSPTQGCYFLMRCPTTASAGTGVYWRAPVAKVARLRGAGKTHQAAALSNVVIGPAYWLIAVPYVAVELAESGTTSPYTSIALVRVEANPTNTGRAIEANGLLLSPQGTLMEYDGLKFTEFNFHVRLEPPSIGVSSAASKTAAIHALFAGNDAASAFPGPFTQPTSVADVLMPSNLTVSFEASWDGGTVTVIGTDRLGRRVSEVFTTSGAGANTQRGQVIFATVASASKSAVGATANRASIGVPSHGVYDFSAGSGTTGSYLYRTTVRYVDAQGLIRRSQPSEPSPLLTSGVDGKITFTTSVPTLRISGYPPVPTAELLMVELWRTDGTGTEPYYLVKTVNNDMTADTTAAVVDPVSDEALRMQEMLPSTGGILEVVSPPQFRAVWVHRGRVWGIDADDPTRLWFTQVMQPGVEPQFCEELTLQIADEYGACTAGASLDGNCIVFKGSAVYAISGDGPDEQGRGSFSVPARVSSTAGTDNARSVVAFDDGVGFESDKGLYLLTRGLSCEFFGAPVEDFSNAGSVVDAIHVPGLNQVRFYIDQIDEIEDGEPSVTGGCLVYDYFFKEWFVWDRQTDRAAVRYGDAVATLDVGEWNKDDSTLYTDDGVGYQACIETSWIPVNQIDGWGHTYKLAFLGNHVGAHRFKVRVYWDYSLVDDAGAARYEEKIIYASDPWRWDFKVSHPKASAFKLRMFDAEVLSGSITTVSVANLVNHESVTIDDGTNDPTVYDLWMSGALPAGRIKVDLTGLTTAAQVATALAAAINAQAGATSLVTATSAVGSLITLASTGAHPVAIADTVANAGFTHTGFTGGDCVTGGFQLSGLAALVGIKPGLARQAAAKRMTTGS